ncbi:MULTISPECIES: thiamine phosphate synthase [unclassified Exiguobacterium]|uniref:thiamine phosphate synthase n=1 Tax=unclassified Exiguobacterium TaxID=2644629 RepID=UPI001BE66AC3|nr:MULTISPECIES: thiamine phosphate synthase [unclassified Exiguobacterium]
MTFCTKQALAKQLRLYFVCGTIDASDLVATVETALRCGVTCFQFREKGKDALYGDEKEAMARTLQRLCGEAGVPFIINDDVDLALAIDADGIHVGQDDLSAEQVRERLGPDKWLGVSVHTMEEVSAALPFADYVGIGPIHETRSKLDAGIVRGTELIQQVRHHYPLLLIVGIGGIRPEHVPSIVHDGADGVAVISAIASAPDVATATRRFACL